MATKVVAWFRRRLVRWGWLEPECLSDEQRLITSEEIEADLDDLLGPRIPMYRDKESERDARRRRLRGIFNRLY